MCAVFEIESGFSLIVHVLYTVSINHGFHENHDGWKYFFVTKCWRKSLQQGNFSSFDRNPEYDFVAIYLETTRTIWFLREKNLKIFKLFKYGSSLSTKTCDTDVPVIWIPLVITGNFCTRPWLGHLSIWINLFISSEIVHHRITNILLNSFYCILLKGSNKSNVCVTRVPAVSSLCEIHVTQYQTRDFKSLILFWKVINQHLNMKVEFYVQWKAIIITLTLSCVYKLWSFGWTYGRV